jgi:hypothetical protein
VLNRCIRVTKVKVSQIRGCQIALGFKKFFKGDSCFGLQVEMQVCCLSCLAGLKLLLVRTDGGDGVHLI